MLRRTFAILALAAAALWASAADARWRPSMSDRFDWQFTQPFNFNRPSSVVSLDAFDIGSGTIAMLRGRGVKPVCYVNVGAWEDWRPDRMAFPSAVVGKNYVGWAGERWFDVRRMDVLLPIMRARMRMCRDKGFLAIEPDNIDGFENDTGFPISRAEQVAYNRAIAREAHALGLAIGLKNAPGLIPELLHHYDFAIAEDCFKWKWCGELRAFTSAGKPAIAIEYPEDGRNPLTHCGLARQMGVQIVIKRRKLDGWSRRCR